MTTREKTLAAAVAAMALLWGGGRMWTRYTNSVAAKRAQLLTAEQQLGEAKLAIAQGEAALAQIAAWQDRSLPADREAAQSDYRVWLQTQLKSAGLIVEDVQPIQRLAPSAGYSAIGFTVNAHGPLKSLTDFLHDYYRSPLLQQITRLQLRPDTNPQQLKISVQTEALILPGTFNEKLPEGVADRSAKPKVADYETSIGGRNVFTVYRPPRPEPPPRTVRDTPPPPKFDDAKFAFFSGTVQTDGRIQAWINVRTTGETLRLFEGDDVKVGLFEGKVVAIEPRAIVVKTGDDELRVELGHNLREGKSTAKAETKEAERQTAAPVSRAFFTPTNDICDLMQV
jgi:hypothetical protein